MKDLSQFWGSLEGIQGLHAIPAFWARYCDPHFDLIRPYLRATDMVGGDYPCPHPKRGGACARRIVDLGDGEFEGICIDPYKLCPDLPLTSKDVVVHRLDIACEDRQGSAVAGQAADRSVGSQAAVNAVHDYLAATVLTLTKFGIQFETTDRTIRRFLRTGKMRRANFEAMATAIGITADQLLRGELPPSIQRRTP